MNHIELPQTITGIQIKKIPNCPNSRWTFPTQLYLATKKKRGKIPKVEDINKLRNMDQRHFA